MFLVRFFLCCACEFALGMFYLAGESWDVGVVSAKKKKMIWYFTDEEIKEFMEHEER